MNSLPIKLLIVVVLPLLSGAAALSHELLWTRRLVDLLGATDWVIGRVLGLFFLGISLGGYLAQRMQWTDRSVLRRLAITELAIAIFALPAAFLPAWTDWIWPLLGTESLLSWQGSILKLVLAGIVVLPPAVAMGFTLPLFVKAATNLGGNVASVGIWTYSLNTLGGVFGLWFTSTCLIGWQGAQASMLVIAALNVAVAVVAFALARATRETNVTETQSGAIEQALEATAKEHKKPIDSRISILLLSFLSGMFVLSLEILILRLLALVAPASYHTTGALLANVIVILAFSSMVVSLLNRFTTPGRWPLVIGLLGGAICCCFCPMILYQQTDQLISIRYLEGLNGRVIDSINHYWMLLFGLVAMVGGSALLCCGLIFPSLLSLSSKEDPAGNRIGLLLAVNGVGGLIGSEAINSIVIPWVGIYQGFYVLAAMIMLVALVMLWRIKWELAIGAAAVAALLVFVGYESSANLPYLSPRSTTNYEIESTKFGPEGVLLVVNDQKGSKSILMNNQYVLGSTGVATDERRQLLLPWLLNPNPDAKTVCSLGLATGIAASGLEGLENPPAITAVELSANVVEIAKQNFGSETNGFFTRPANTVVVEDARTYIAAASNQFDIIVADLFRPHGIGEGRLYSVEHFQNVRKALTDNGIFCQWLPVHQLNQTSFETIAATFQKVFPETLVVFGNADQRVPVLGLISKKADTKWDSEMLGNIPPELVKNDPLLADARNLVVGVLRPDAFSNAPINSLDNLSVEISAGEFWILKDLRRDRPRSNPESEFLSGDRLKDFSGQLKQLTNPIFSNNREPAKK